MKIKEKISEFYKKHPVGCNVAIGAIGITVLGLIKYKFSHTESVDEEIVEIPFEYMKEAEEKIADDDIETEIVETESKTINDRYEWKEEYREGWNMVHEFSKTLPLIDGESYYIERNSEYSDDPIISHMIDDSGVYPPDDDKEEESAGSIAS